MQWLEATLVNWCYTIELENLKHDDAELVLKGNLKTSITKKWDFECGDIYMENIYNFLLNVIKQWNKSAFLAGIVHLLKALVPELC